MFDTEYRGAALAAKILSALFNDAWVYSLSIPVFWLFRKFVTLLFDLWLNLLERYDRAAIESWIDPAYDNTSFSFSTISISSFSGDFVCAKNAFWRDCNFSSFPSDWANYCWVFFFWISYAAFSIKVLLALFFLLIYEIVSLFYATFSVFLTIWF